MNNFENFIRKSNLKKAVVDSILEHGKDCSGETQLEKIRQYCNEVIQYGCSSGIVTELIYTADTTAFYENHKVEINELISEALEGTGFSIAEFFCERWDKTDPLVLEDVNQELLTWFAYEEITNQFVNFFEG